MIRLHRLQETQRLKEELEQKLGHLQGRIEVLNDLQGSPKPQKTNLLKKEVRRQYMEQEEARRRETSEFSKKLSEDQKNLNRKRKQEAREMQKIALEEEAKQAEKERMEKEAAMLRLKEMEKAKFEALAKKRKEYLESLSKLPTKRQPKIEKNVSMPNLAKKREESTSKRNLESWADIKSHMLTYDQTKKQHEERNVGDNFMVNPHGANQPKIVKSKFFETVQAEEARLKDAEAKHHLDLQHRLELKKRYGDIIKEMYAPEVDPYLRDEIQKRPEKLHTKRRAVNIDATRNSWPSPSAWRETISPKSELVRKGKKSEEEKVTEKKPIDYLKAQKMQRKAEEEQLLKQLKSPAKSPVLADNSENMQEQLSKMEQLALRKEKLLQRLNPDNRHVLEAQFEVATGMLESVKSKMALLKSP